jgi:hypothetical protein
MRSLLLFLVDSRSWITAEEEALPFANIPFLVSGFI